MAVTNNKPLADIECDGCGGKAAIKQRSNGKRLYYLHCSTCGTDQRSGTQIQAKWASAVLLANEVPPKIKTEITVEPAPKKQAISATIDEWSPDQPNTPKSKPNDTEKTAEGATQWGAIGFGVLTVICLGIGIKLKA